MKMPFKKKLRTDWSFAPHTIRVYRCVLKRNGTFRTLRTHPDIVHFAVPVSQKQAMDNDWFDEHKIGADIYDWDDHAYYSVVWKKQYLPRRKDGRLISRN